MGQQPKLIIQQVSTLLHLCWTMPELYLYQSSTFQCLPTNIPRASWPSSAVIKGRTRTCRDATRAPLQEARARTRTLRARELSPRMCSCSDRNRRVPGPRWGWLHMCFPRPAAYLNYGAGENRRLQRPLCCRGSLCARTTPPQTRLLELQICDPDAEMLR